MLSCGMVRPLYKPLMHRWLKVLFAAGRLSHPDMPEQKKSGNPVYAPSAVAANGGKFRQLPGEPGYQTVSTRADSAANLLL